VCLFWKLALQGEREAAAACVGEHLLACAWNVEFWAWMVAECYAFNGERTLALDWLENPARRGFVHYPYLSARSHVWRAFDADSRFQKLMSEVKTTWEHLQQV